MICWPPFNVMGHKWSRWLRTSDDILFATVVHILMNLLILRWAYYWRNFSPFLLKAKCRWSVCRKVTPYQSNKKETLLLRIKIRFSLKLFKDGMFIYDLPTYALFLLKKSLGLVIVFLFHFERFVRVFHVAIRSVVSASFFHILRKEIMFNGHFSRRFFHVTICKFFLLKFLRLFFFFFSNDFG